MILRNSLLENSSFTLEGALFYQSGVERSGSFEKAYIELRKRENRIYDDATLKLLPEIKDPASLKNEWFLRKASLKKLVELLAHQNKKLIILELGCGNGWLSHQLSAALHAEICGMDVNELELHQAARVFGDTKDLSFVYGDIFAANFKNLQFDTIILASSIQYFPNLKLLIERLLTLLTTAGEILIIDSPLYPSIADVNEARKRSHQYFQSVGFPEMSERYFHHTLGDLKTFTHTMAYDPSSIKALFKRNILRQKLPVFPHIKIRPN
jgi:ubiquinone/menaquinone biosynthesis C-methylase UbiE